MSISPVRNRILKIWNTHLLSLLKYKQSFFKIVYFFFFFFFLQREAEALEKNIDLDQ